MPDTLHTRLLAALDERLERARAATPGPWIVDDPNGGDHLPFWMVINDAFVNPPTDDETPWLAVEVHTGVEGDARHIAANAPDVEIRRVEALRRVVAEYQRALAGCKEHPEDFALKGALLALHGVVALLAEGEGIEP